MTEQVTTEEIDGVTVKTQPWDYGARVRILATKGDVRREITDCLKEHAAEAKRALVAEVLAAATGGK